MAVDERLTPETGVVSVRAAGLKVFINYRRDDVPGVALLLQRELAARFGADNVFFDLKSIQPGRRWLEETRTQGSACTAFIALIGSRWVSILAERARSAEEDHVSGEIELALRYARRGSGIVIIPTLIDDAPMPKQSEVPRPLWPLLARESLPLRLAQWDDDFERLIETLGSIEREADHRPPSLPTPLPAALASPPTAAGSPAVDLRRPGSSHYQDVKDVIRDGSLITFLGPGANSSDREERSYDSESGYLPDDAELAAYLAKKFSVSPEPALLAMVSQGIAVARGQGDLCRTLTTTLGARVEPSSVHRFLASLPRILHDAGLPEHQLILTTNYDNSLEQAFTDAEEPFDLAVYMASDGGRFAHFPYEGEPAEIRIGTANEYGAFPIDDWGKASRTVIVKIRGAVDGAFGRYAWQDNYVITEDDYIDYLSQSDVDSIVPLQIRNTLRYGHFLFLGYAMLDWNLRVFLHRIFGRGQLNNSWAIQRNPDRLEEKFWRRINVDFFGIPLSDYVRELEGHLQGTQGAEQS